MNLRKEGNAMNEERVYRITVPTPFPVGDVHMYVIAGDRLTLVDAGVKTEEAWQLFVKQLGEVGYAPEDIEQIVITHHHPDHVACLIMFRMRRSSAIRKRIRFCAANVRLWSGTSNFFRNFLRNAASTAVCSVSCPKKADRFATQAGAGLTSW